MARILLTAAAAVALLGAVKPPRTDYELTFSRQASPALEVRIKLRGDADGETRLTVPAGAADLTVRGASVEAPDAGHRVLRHRPGARLTVRYRLAPSMGGDGLAVLGEQVFAAAEGRGGEAARVKLGKPPAGWRLVSDLEHGPATTGEVVRSAILAGPKAQVVERATPGGTLRAASLSGDPQRLERLADAAASAVTALRSFWGDESGPFLVAAGPFAGPPADRGDAVALAESGDSDADLRVALAEAHMRAWIPGRTGRTPPAPAWLNGLSDLYATRLMLRAGQLGPDAVVGRLSSADQGRDPAQRGQILALKWDEDIRWKTAGKADLDDVLVRMRDHYRQFAPGQGPDVLTALVSAAWVTAGIDLRPDIARYGEGSAPIPLPEIMFDGCLDARVTVAPGFDAGFDTRASFAAKRLAGVRSRGPAWNSGLRNGMALESWTFDEGDTSREIELKVRDARKRLKTVRYWPYGDNDTTSRKLMLAHGLSGEKLAACGRKIGGL